MSFLHLAIFSPFLGALIVPFLYRYIHRIHTGWVVLLLPLFLFIYFLRYLGIQSSFKSSLHWIPSLTVSVDFVINGLTLLFALLITGIGMLVVLYSIFYLSKEHEGLNHFYVYLLLFMGAMLGVVLSDNLIVLYTFWELTSISSFLLIAYWHEREKSRYGAQKSMIITILGGLSMLAGFVLLYGMTGSFSINEIILSGDLSNHHLFLPAMICILVGAFTKSAQFPFYIWLPDAMEAPTPVSAYLHSATMVKAGIFLVAKLMPIFGGTTTWFWMISLFGLFTLFWGSFNAVKQTDLKSILAFSTVSQLGLIMSLLGIGSLALFFDFIKDNIFVIAITAAIFHLINHATFKGCLFMVVGIIDHETGTRDIRHLSGLIRYMPVTFTLATIAALSMAGLPPFNGFLSKEMFFTGMLQATKTDLFNLSSWGVFFPIIAWVASVFTFVYSLIIVGKVFLGKPDLEKLKSKPHEPPIGMLLPPMILAVLVIVLGLIPNLLSNSLIKPALEAILPHLGNDRELFNVDIYFWHGWTAELMMSIAIIIVGTLLYVTFPRWKVIYHILPKKLTLNKFYDQLLINLEKASSMVTERIMTGSIRTYLIYIFVFFILVISTSLLTLHALSYDFSYSSEVQLYELVLALVMVLPTIMIVTTNSRLTAIIALGTVGYLLSLFFVIFRAPDLALTQLIVETISVVLFLLCFHRLPTLSKNKRTFNILHFFISIAVGVIITALSLSAAASKLLEPISTYFIDASYEEAGGKNMVNVILVDFRGIDTLFEITVLSIAALAIFSMIKLRLSRRDAS